MDSNVNVGDLPTVDPTAPKVYSPGHHYTDDEGSPRWASEIGVCIGGWVVSIVDGHLAVNTIGDVAVSTDFDEYIGAVWPHTLRQPLKIHKTGRKVTKTGPAPVLATLDPATGRYFGPAGPPPAR